MRGNSLQITSIAIAGAGKTGKCLARALVTAGQPLNAILSRNPALVTLDNELAGIPHLPVNSFSPVPGTLLICSVPDDVIASFASGLAPVHNWGNTVVVHCSGAIPASILQPFRVRGAHVAGFHPIQTFTEDSGQDVIRGIYISLQGDEQALNVLKPVAHELGAKSLIVDEAGKLRLHVAAVFSSNYMSALLEAAQLILGEDISVEEVMQPLFGTAAGNIEKSGRTGALTGPIVRGDAGTILKHLEILGGNPELKKLYIQLGRLTLSAARRAGNITDYSDIEKVLEKLHTAV